jgi:predicted RNA-binding Zn ribbon-like protein
MMLPVEPEAMERVAAEGPVPFFFGGRVCLDFVNTVNSRSRPATKDYLPDFDALLGWSRQTRLLDASVLRRLDRMARTAPDEALHAHGAATILREALYRLFRSVIDGAGAPDRDLRLVDTMLREARQRQSFAASPSGFEWIWNVARLDLNAPAFAVALSAAELLAGEDLRRLKECPGPDGCGWLFYDETKNGSRRWCSMDHCGSAAKARRYAARHRA